MNAPTFEPHNVLILGAGYAGMAAATQLAGRVKQREDVRITVVNADERFVEKLRLHQVAAGEQLAHLSIPELLAGDGIEFVQGWVSGVDADARTVRLDDRVVRTYDTLVYGLGSVADTDTVPGVDDYAYTLDTHAGAERLAERLANLTAGGTVVIAGSGLTGVEAAAEIAEQHPELRVVLLGRDAPGPRMNPKARDHMLSTLGRLGVDVRAGAEIVKVLTDTVELAGGESIPADAVLWTTGVHVSPMAAAAGLDVDERGRIVTDAALRSVSHPDVYAVGDAAAVAQKFGVLHGTCQSGMPTGVHAAMAIARELKGKQPKPFRFGYYHAPVSLGRHDGVVQFTKPNDTPRRMFLKGGRAAWYKETVSSSPWPTYRRMNTHPRTGALWPHGGRYTRGVAR